jgi:hypothetical protein
MGYDLFWCLVVFSILVSAVIYYGITDAPEEERKEGVSGSETASTVEGGERNDKETGPEQDRDKSP